MGISTWTAAKAVALAVALMTTGASAAGGAPTGHTRRCGEKTWAGSGGGYATAIQDLRVRGVTCARGLRIAGHSLDGHPPAGWHCRLAAHPIRCVSQRRLVTFVNGGDAG
jgi:hypothetical protein